jgi:hypothetical protein
LENGGVQNGRKTECLLNKTILNSSLGKVSAKVDDMKGSIELKCYNNPIHGIRKCYMKSIGTDEAARKMEDALDIMNTNPIRNPIGRSDNPYVNKLKHNSLCMSPFKEVAKDLIFN